MLKLIRPLHWLKNTLVFLPILLAPSFSFGQVWDLVGLFFGLAAVSSAGYVLNDLKDAEADKLHPKKQFRPIASGEISKKTAFTLLFACLFIGVATGVLFGTRALVFILAYFVGTVLYSMLVKHSFPGDLIWLSGLYVLRLTAALVVGQFEVSTLLLSFVFVLFLSLSSAKRYVELTQGNVGLSRKAYDGVSSDFVRTWGIGFAAVSIAILVAYSSTSDIEGEPGGIVLAVLPIILSWWLMRFWLKVVDEVTYPIWDPVLWAAKDWPTWLSFAACTLVVYLANMT